MVSDYNIQLKCFQSEELTQNTITKTIIEILEKFKHDNEY